MSGRWRHRPGGAVDDRDAFAGFRVAEMGGQCSVESRFVRQVGGQSVSLLASKDNGKRVSGGRFGCWRKWCLSEMRFQVLSPEKKSGGRSYGGWVSP